jgi:hypothetical protein
MSELRRKGVPRSDLKIVASDLIASDPDLAAITKDEASCARLDFRSCGQVAPPVVPAALRLATARHTVS